MSFAVCQRHDCGRPLVPGLHDAELHDWFVAQNVQTGRVVVRCPRHLTRWTARQAGVKWTNEWRAWAEAAYESDLKRYPVVTPSWTTPIPTEHL